MHILHLLFVVIEFAIVLGIMVLVHEFGHFAVAKLCGVRVETFSIGFGKRVIGYTYGDTDYRLSILPLGGYVKFAGDEPGYQPGSPARGQAIDVLGVDIDTEAFRTAAGDFNRPDTSAEFNARPRWQRVLIALAGPISNFILSFFLLALVAHYHHEVDKYRNGPAIVDYVPQNSPAARIGLVAGDTIVSFNGVDNPTWDQALLEMGPNLNNHSVPLSFSHNGEITSRSLDMAPAGGEDFSEAGPAAIGLIPREQPGPIGVETISAGTPAARAGLKPGDQIVRIDSLQPHSVTALHAYLKDRAGAPSTLSILRNGVPITITLSPEKVASAPSYAQYQIGFLPHPNPVDVVKLPLGAAIRQSLKDNRDGSTLILRVLQGMFTRHVSVKSLSGPVGIAQQIDIATQLGLWTLFTLIATISLNLGIFNLLPFPPLDGGMILFLLIESILRRDVNQQVKERIYQIAFVCVVFLAVFVLFNDITRLHLGH
jgi:regulator of sigma E protease